MPLFSVFTPTHNTQYLSDAYNSLRAQPEKCWEWIILLNGAAMIETVPLDIRQDSRVRIQRHVPAKTKSKPTIGELKKACCKLAIGEYLVELDHDDMLMPLALDRISQKLKQTPADFIFSDCCCFKDKTGEPYSYNANFGFETYTVQLYGEEYLATAAFPVTPRSLFEIYTAPDHVRIWRREFYDKIGGHREDLIGADDHELICKSYVNNGRFLHIDSPEYLYRWHDHNSVPSLSSEIAAQSRRNGEYYTERLVANWLKRESLPSITLDWADVNGSRLKYKKELRSVTNHFGHVHFANVHMATYDAVFSKVSHAYRALVPGGYFSLQFPTDNARYGAYRRSEWTDFTLGALHIQQEALKMPQFQNGYVFQRMAVYTSPIPELPEWRQSCGWFSAIKGQKQPGRILMSGAHTDD